MRISFTKILEKGEKPEMPGIKATGIVIKQTEFGESNRMLSIFTKEFGIIRASVYGAKSIKSSKGAASQLLAFSEFELSKGFSDIYTVSSAHVEESFFKLSEDIEKLSLAVYLSDITYTALGMENADGRVLSLFLNTLYALCYNNLEVKKAKAVYELKLMTLSGYMPVLNRCVKCGSLSGIARFSAASGGLICSGCAPEGVGVTKSIVDAMNYIINADTKRMFSFKASDDLILKLGNITEDYVVSQLETEFKSLKYLKSIKI